MFALFIIAVVLTVILAVIAISTKGSPNPDVQDFHKGAKVFAWVMVPVTLLVLFFASVAVVETKNVGIVLAFNSTEGTLSNGFHFKAPWQDVAEMDAAIQTDTYHHSTGNCVTVRIAYQIVACADVTVQWRIHESAAAQLYQNYRGGIDNVRSSLVARRLSVAVNSVFQDYDPLAVDANGNSLSPSLVRLSGDVLDQLRNTVGPDIDVLAINIPVIHFDSATQARINDLQAQIAKTRIALQAEKTAQAQAAANQELAASVSNDPGVLVSRCLDIWTEMVNRGMSIPAGFSGCVGSGSAVVLPAGK